MLYLYLDESGDLGFDFINKKPSNYFTICILTTDCRKTNDEFSYAVKKTLKRKLNLKKKSSRQVTEIKGYTTDITIKKYLWQQIKKLDFYIYAVTLHKKKLLSYSFQNKSRLYNYVARLVIDKIPFDSKKTNTVYLIVDKSKGKTEVKKFNDYILNALEARLEIKTDINIIHIDSKERAGLQLSDIFSYGIFKKYEQDDKTWFKVFESKIIDESLYNKDK